MQSSPGGLGHKQMCETNPIWLVGCGPENEMCKTNPIRWGQMCETNPIGWSQSCETNPISPARTAPEARGAGEFCETKPIPARRGAAGGSGFPLSPPCSPGQLRQTNPISGSGKEEASVLPERSYGELYTSRALAKQSQLPEAGHRGGVSIAGCGFWIAGWGTDSRRGD